jgi:hypothetical protein
MSRRSYWRENTKVLFASFISMSAHLPKQDVSGDANTHLGAAQTPLRVISAMHVLGLQ